MITKTRLLVALLVACAAAGWYFKPWVSELSGLVVDLAGDPVPNAEIMVSKPGASGMEGPVWAKTDGEGLFISERRYRGPVHVQANPPGGFVRIDDSGRRVSPRETSEPILLRLKKFEGVEPADKTE